MEKKFCPYCGTKLDDGAHFCKNCGESLYQDTQGTYNTSNRQSTMQNHTNRQTVYEGDIHKCPSCGEILDSFSAKCPACGYEIRNRQVANSIQELVKKLEIIDSREWVPPLDPVVEFPDTEEVTPDPPSAMKQLIGWDFHEKQRREAAQNARIAKEEAQKRIQKEHKKNILRAEKNFDRSKQLEKANLIQNFPIPNTKEDILEFALLISANVNTKNTIPNIVLKAWIGKLDQVYQKATLFKRRP